MHAQAQITGQVSGQVTGQVGGQLSGLAQQNGSSLASQASNHGGMRRSWHTDADVLAVRRHIIEKISQIFQRHPISPEWQQRLPEFVKRLEEGLFKEAVSKEEYMDSNSLERRLQQMVKRFQPPNTRNQNRSHHNPPLGPMIPTPGLQQNGNVSSMIPTPGNDISTANGPGNGNMVPNTMGNMLPNSNDSSSIMHGNSLLASDGCTSKMVPTPGLTANIFSHSGDNISSLPGQLNNTFHSQQGISNISTGMGNHIMPTINMPRVGSQMIPTPGLSTPQSVSINCSSSGGLGHSNVDLLTAAQQQQQYSGGQNNRMYNMNGQVGGTMGINMQSKNSSYGLLNGSMSNGMQLMSGNQHLMNGTNSLSNTGSFVNASRFGHLQMSSQQHINQQRQRQLMQPLSHTITPLASDSYAMNAADLAGSGNMYNAATSGGLTAGTNLNSNSLGIHSKMIPVPGLSSQQPNLHVQQQVQQNKSQSLDSSQQINFQSPRGTLFQQYQQQLQQPYQQNVQHQFQHYQQQHHQNEQNQNQQQSLKNEEVQSIQPMPKLSAQKHSGIGMQPQGEALQHFIPQPTNENFQPQVTGPQAQQSQSRGLHMHQDPSNLRLLCPPLSQSQHQQQVSSPQAQEQQQTQSQNDSNSFPAELQTDAVLQSLQESQSQEKLHLPDQVPCSTEQGLSLAEQQHLPQEVEQSISNHNESENNQQPQQSSVTGTISTITNQSRGETPSGAMGLPGQPNNIALARQQQYIKQQRWLLFLRHASKCSAAEGQCQTSHCWTAQKLWAHITKCHESNCSYSRCQASRTLLRHHQQCRDIKCPVCGPVRQIIMQRTGHGQGQSSSQGETGPANGVRKSVNSNNTGEINATLPSKSWNAVQEAVQIQQPPLKKAKTEPSSPNCGVQQVETTQGSTPNLNKKQGASQVQPQVFQQTGQCAALTKSETLKVAKAEPISEKMEPDVSFNSFISQKSAELKDDATVEHGQASWQAIKPDPSATSMSNAPVQVKQELVSAKNEAGQLKPELGQVKQEVATAVLSDNSAASKLGKSKMKGVSLTELFTPEQIREHIVGLRQWVGQSKAKAEKNQAMESQMSENSCQLCAVERLTFEPPPIYCTPCGARIKRNAAFYTMGSGDTRHYFCIPCYNEVRGDTIEVDGVTLLKSRLEKKKNDEEVEEAWVQCDKCEGWQHQICALFNGRRNEGGQAEYTCPNCYVVEVERGERKPLPQSAVLGAKDLPRTLLSDHIEQRLFQRLKHERQERARALGKSFEEVPGADSLVVRVVSSVDKKLEVKQRFLEIFQEEDYPIEFPYKSKVVLLFQKIEGVEVCLFGMYVQEFGSECAHPNQRRVYLSYLDSVKYFRPEVKTVTGEALRTFVYHEILIAYLDYCKRRGLTSCYIWACPPLKGEDYILYCHPEIQKTPKSDKLREWYLTMLRKAMKEEIVVELTNLYDHFFVSAGECKSKVTAARLPYFDGDYWPGAAEDMIMQLQQAEENGRKHQKKGKTKKTATKRASKAAALAELANNASKDALLMQKLGESIFPMKEDFIMVHMQHACSHCCHFIVSGKRWFCKQCKNFNLCDKCYVAEQKLDERERHPINGKEKHALFSVEVTDVPADTRDRDEIVESEFFDTRQAFLSLCQGNHYQYDTLRRAKHSSMMVLYHLHNPTAPAFVTTCNICHHDIETGQGWRCETCPDFDICNACYQKVGSADHPHKLTTHPSTADRDAQNQEARQQRVLQLRIMLDLLVHASQCCSSHCVYPNCRRVKGLFRHGMQCKVRASGGCPLCKKMWYLLQLHARACKESECRVPRCRDLKEHLRRLQQQMESRRRAAVMEMMRQRAAEVAASSN
ncbi:histone acetyltransferase HAC1 isoform X1 [Cryptomeria japonica]|uniref:histone acetyltransferase HAC1 isoform X1 n=1 Tax=Cryptomeria japonica TaxID=3369 RepID=UPI0025AD1551|nr:histone acetyltransferase HAC1 isoform X1 [Cryptomeria japonica]